jgi:hypothetical protein
VPKSMNLFVTEDDYGLSMTSPQLPELIFGRRTRTEFLRDYKDALKWAGVKTPVQLVGHWQKRGITPRGEEYVIRWQTGEDFNEADRLDVANKVNRALSAGEDALNEILDELEPARTGEYQIVVCLADDTVGWLLDQLRPDGDVLVAAMGVAGVMVAMTQVGTEPGLDWPSIDELGWTRDTTMGQLLAQRSAGRPLAIKA